MSELKHQLSQAFPKLDAELVDERRNISVPWYRLLVSLWNRTGGNTPVDTFQYVNQTGPGLVAVSPLTGVVTPIVGTGDLTIIEAEIALLQSQVETLQEEVWSLGGPNGKPSNLPPLSIPDSYSLSR